MSTGLMKPRKQGKGSYPGKAGRPARLSVRQLVNKAPAGIMVAFKMVYNYRSEAAIHDWLRKKNDAAGFDSPPRKPPAREAPIGEETEGA